MHEEKIQATEDRFGDRHLAVVWCGQLKTWTQDNGEPLQEVATAIEQMTHHAIPALPKNRGHGGLGGASGNGMMDRGMERQLPLGSKYEALGQNF
jgi:hypothetical protein